MGIQADIKDALDGDREDLIEVLAEHRVRPTVVEQAESGGSGLLGGSATPSFRLDSADGTSAVVDRQTTTHVVDALGLGSEEDCEAVCKEIENHSAWGRG